jgi:hypothetical protein
VTIYVTGAVHRVVGNGDSGKIIVVFCGVYLLTGDIKFTLFHQVAWAENSIKEMCHR